MSIGSLWLRSLLKQQVVAKRRLRILTNLRGQPVPSLFSCKHRFPFHSQPVIIAWLLLNVATLVAIVESKLIFDHKFVLDVILCYYLRWLYRFDLIFVCYYCFWLYDLKGGLPSDLQEGTPQQQICCCCECYLPLLWIWCVVPIFEAMYWPWTWMVNRLEKLVERSGNHCPTLCVL